MRGGTVLVSPKEWSINKIIRYDGSRLYAVPAGSTYRFGAGNGQSMLVHEGFDLEVPPGKALASESKGPGFVLPERAKRLVPGSSWGTFTIACTIPIALCL